MSQHNSSPADDRSTALCNESVALVRRALLATQVSESLVTQAKGLCQSLWRANRPKAVAALAQRVFAVSGPALKAPEARPAPSEVRPRFRFQRGWSEPQKIGDDFGGDPFFLRN